MLFTQKNIEAKNVFFDYTHKVVLSYVAVAVFKLFVACFHLGNLSCANASLQAVVVKVEGRWG